MWITGSRTIFGFHSFLPIILLALLQRLHHGLTQTGVTLPLSIPGIPDPGDIVGDIVEGFVNAFFSIIELIVGAFADTVGDKMAKALMDVILYTPLPIDSQGRPAIATRPVNGPWPEIWDIYWGRFLVSAIILGLLVYVIANSISTIPFIPVSIRKRFRGGFWRLLFALPIAWPTMITTLYLMDVLINIIAPAPDRLGVWVGGIITATLTAIAVSGPAAVIWGVLGLIHVTLMLILVTLYVLRIIYLTFGVLMSPFAVTGLALRVPFVKGISKKLLSWWVQIGLAPAISAALFRVAVIFMTDPDGNGGWELASTWGPGGTGIFFDLAVGMALPFIGIGSFFIALTATMPSSVTRGLLAARLISGQLPSKSSKSSQGSAAPATSDDGGKGGGGGSRISGLTSKAKNAWDGEYDYNLRGYSSSDALDAMNDDEIKEFQESNAIDPKEFMDKRIDSGGYEQADDVGDFIRQRRKTGEATNTGGRFRSDGLKGVAFGAVSKELTDEDIDALDVMSEEELEEFAQSDTESPTDWVSEQVDSTTDARSRYHDTDNQAEWLEERRDDDKAWTATEVEDGYRKVASNEDLNKVDHLIWKRMNPLEKRGFINSYNSGGTSTPQEYIRKQAESEDIAYTDVEDPFEYLDQREERHDADEWGSLGDWDRTRESEKDPSVEDDNNETDSKRDSRTESSPFGEQETSGEDDGISTSDIFGGGGFTGSTGGSQATSSSASESAASSYSSPQEGVNDDQTDDTTVLEDKVAEFEDTTDEILGTSDTTDDQSPEETQPQDPFDGFDVAPESLFDDADDGDADLNDGSSSETQETDEYPEAPKYSTKGVRDQFEETADAQDDSSDTRAEDTQTEDGRLVDEEGFPIVDETPDLEPTATQQARAKADQMDPNTEVGPSNEAGGIGDEKDKSIDGEDGAENEYDDLEEELGAGLTKAQREKILGQKVEDERHREKAHFAEEHGVDRAANAREEVDEAFRSLPPDGLSKQGIWSKSDPRHEVDEATLATINAQANSIEESLHDDVPLDNVSIAKRIADRVSDGESIPSASLEVKENIDDIPKPRMPIMRPSVHQQQAGNSEPTIPMEPTAGAKEQDTESEQEAEVPVGMSIQANLQADRLLAQIDEDIPIGRDEVSSRISERVGNGTALPNATMDVAEEIADDYDLEDSQIATDSIPSNLQPESDPREGMDPTIRATIKAQAESLDEFFPDDVPLETEDIEQLIAEQVDSNSLIDADGSDQGYRNASIASASFDVWDRVAHASDLRRTMTDSDSSQGGDWSSGAGGEFESGESDVGDISAKDRLPVETAIATEMQADHLLDHFGDDIPIDRDDLSNQIAKRVNEGDPLPEAMVEVADEIAETYDTESFPLPSQKPATKPDSDPREEMDPETLATINKQAQRLQNHFGNETAMEKATMSRLLAKDIADGAHPAEAMLDLKEGIERFPHVKQDIATIDPYDQHETTVEGEVSHLFDPKDSSQRQVGLISDDSGSPIKTVVWRNSGDKPTFHEGDKVRLELAKVNAYEGEPTLAVTSDTNVIRQERNSTGDAPRTKRASEDWDPPSHSVDSKNHSWVDNIDFEKALPLTKQKLAEQREQLRREKQNIDGYEDDHQPADRSESSEADVVPDEAADLVGPKNADEELGDTIEAATKRLEDIAREEDSERESRDQSSAPDSGDVSGDTTDTEAHSADDSAKEQTDQTEED